MNHILVFGEKPYINKALAADMAKAFPSQDIIYLNVLPFTNPSLSYPANLHPDNYPAVNSPVFNSVKLEALRPMRLVDDEIVYLSDLDAAQVYDVVHNCDRIIYACDPDHSGAVSFSVIAKQWYGDGILENKKLTAINVATIDEYGIGDAISKQGPFLQKFSASLSYGEAKRFIDWNWNVNSLAILSESMRRAGVEQSDPAISKYALQALFFIRDNPGLSEGNVYRSFSHWKGTEKYPESVLGSAASIDSIVNQLTKLGLVDRSRPEGKASYLRISETGERFLESLHDSAFDPDLPGRINQWCTDGLEKSRNEIEQYMLAMFGSQKDVLSQASRPRPA